MNLDKFKNRRVAVLFFSNINNLPEELLSWKIADFDAFCENLDIWADLNKPLIENLFSKPIKGLKQNVTDCRFLNIGLAGENLINSPDITKIKEEYLKRGFDIILMYPNTKPQFLFHESDTKVRINWKVNE